MRMIRCLFKIPDTYMRSVKDYSGKDTAMAAVLFVLYCIAMVVSGIVANYLSGFYLTIFGGILNLFFVGVVFLFLILNKQGTETVGLKNGNIKLSLISGIALAGILFFCNCLLNIMLDGQKFVSLNTILLYVFYFFTVGLCEEVVFRGYILTRLYGVIKNVYVDILLSSVLFVLFHYPYRMIAYNMSFIQFITNVPYMADLFITSLILSYIRVRSDSIYGAIIPHWISDFSYSIITRM